GELGRFGGGDGLGDAGGVGAGELGAADGGDLRGGELGGQPVGQGGHVHGGAVVLEAGQDVVGEAVAAREAAGLHGRRADERDPGGLGGQRQHLTGVLQQDDRLLGHQTGQVAAVLLVEVDGLPGGGGVEVRVQQAQLDLLAQDASHRGVEHLDL